MKTIVLTLAMISSVQVFASSTTLDLSESTVRKEAAVLVKDIQEFSLTGALSVTLKQKVSDALSSNPELSVEEAVEVIFENEMRNL